MDLPYGVYILLCANGKYYTGFTTNIINRLIAHSKGEVSFTKEKLPIELVHFSLFATKQKAYDFERYLKSGSGIAFRNKRFCKTTKQERSSWLFNCNISKVRTIFPSATQSLTTAQWMKT